MNQVSEEIDVRILRILGLEDVFDLDYDTYLTLLKEAIVKGSFGSSKIPDEELSLLANERKRIRGEKGRFTVKKQKITADKLATSKLLKPSKKSLLLAPKGGIGASGSIVGGDLLDISRRLDGILKSLTDQNKLYKKSEENKRKSREDEARKRKESKLESGLKPIASLAKKVLAPVQGILDSIVRFIVFTVLGRAFKLFMDWASDPKNKEKIKVVGRFLKDWWPALLGAWFFFANPLGRFIRTVVGTVLKLTFQIGKFAIPKLLSFIRTNPLVAAGAATGLATFGAEMWRSGEESKQIKREASKRNIKPEVVKSELDQSKSSIWGMFGEAFSKVGPFGGLAGGGKVDSIFSGLVDHTTGSYVSGAGPDTQFFPIHGGGGAVLQKGESVLQVGARERMIQDTGVDPLAYNVGANANKPRTLGNNILASSLGGVLGATDGRLIGLANGGMIGEGIGLNGKNAVVNDRPWNSGIPLKKMTTKSGLSYMVAHNLASKFRGFVNELESTGYRIKYIGGYRRAGGSAEEQGTPAADYDKGRFAHPYGAGIDINEKQNPYREDGKLITDFPPNISKMAKKYGLGWGGDWSSKKDTMHFSFLKNERGNGVDLNYGGSLWKLPFTPIKPKQQSEQQINPGFFGALTSGISSMFSGKSKKRRRGGLIGESDGSDYGPDGNRLEGADRQYFSFFAQPGESGIIFTKVATERGAIGYANEIQRLLDPTSEAATKSGKYALPPPKRGGGKVQVLPPIKKSGGKISKPGQVPETVVPSFPVIPSAAHSTRFKIIETYGIM